jgi:hypothetical protein
MSLETLRQAALLALLEDSHLWQQRRNQSQFVVFVQLVPSQMLVHQYVHHALLDHSLILALALVHPVQRAHTQQEDDRA